MPNHAILHRNYRPVFSFSPFVPSLGVPCVSAIAGSPTTRSQSSEMFSGLIGFKKRLHLSIFPSSDFDYSGAASGLAFFEEHTSHFKEMFSLSTPFL